MLCCCGFTSTAAAEATTPLFDDARLLRATRERDGTVGREQQRHAHGWGGGGAVIRRRTGGSRAAADGQPQCRARYSEARSAFSVHSVTTRQRMPAPDSQVVHPLLPPPPPPEVQRKPVGGRPAAATASATASASASRAWRPVRRPDPAGTPAQAHGSSCPRPSLPAGLAVGWGAVVQRALRHRR
jgi:hypothetical protein